MAKHWPPEIMERVETLDYIIESGCSIGRYGDGEVSIMTHISVGFQKRNGILAKELSAVARSDDPGFLVCIPHVLVDDSEKTGKHRKWWKNYKRWNMFFWRIFFSRDYRYGDAEVTRPWLAINDVEYAENYFPRLFSLWADRDILLIEGKQSRVGVGNDIFKDAKSVTRILGPVKNAYDKIDEIQAEALKYPRTHLVILALGPTATVLAYRLHKAGYRALDIGHIDLEYEWFKMRATTQVPINHRYVNEAGGEKTFFDDGALDKSYFNEIAAVIE